MESKSKIMTVATRGQEIVEDSKEVQVIVTFFLLISLDIDCPLLLATQYYWLGETGGTI